MSAGAAHSFLTFSYWVMLKMTSLLSAMPQKDWVPPGTPSVISVRGNWSTTTSLAPILRMASQR